MQTAKVVICSKERQNLICKLPSVRCEGGFDKFDGSSSFDIFDIATPPFAITIDSNHFAAAPAYGWISGPASPPWPPPPPKLQSTWTKFCNPNTLKSSTKYLSVGLTRLPILGARLVRLFGRDGPSSCASHQYCNVCCQINLMCLP